jgi:hypothetical protein
LIKEKWKEVYAQLTSEFKETSEVSNLCKRFKTDDFTNKKSENQVARNNDELYVNNQKERIKFLENEKNIPEEKNEKINQAMKILSEDDYLSAKQKKREEEQPINPDIKYDNYFHDKNNDLNKVIYVNPVKNRISNKNANVEKKAMPEEKPAIKSNLFI